MTNDLILPGLEGYAKRDESLGQWDTHPKVCEVFVEWAGIGPSDVVLEPCAGIGNLAVACERAGASVWANEIDPERAALAAARLANEVSIGDFLAGGLVVHRRAYTVAAENPPYEKDGETRFLTASLRFAPRACAIVRAVALASASRVEAWESMDVKRIANVYPRPVFAGSHGMDEIVFVEVMRRYGAPGPSTPKMEWITWR